MEINYIEAIAKQGCSQVEELDFVITLQRIKLLLRNDKPTYSFYRTISTKTDISSFNQ